VPQIFPVFLGHQITEILEQPIKKQGKPKKQMKKHQEKYMGHQITEILEKPIKKQRKPRK
jgi:glutamine synthetase type III